MDSDSSSSSSSSLSSDNEESIPRHDRQMRVEVTKAVAQRITHDDVPVYCVNQPDFMFPQKTVVVNGKIGRVYMSPGGYPKRSFPEDIKPLLAVTSGPLADMAAIQKIMKKHPNPTAIVFKGVEGKNVWLLFQFYKELTGFKPGEDKSAVSAALRNTVLDLKLAANHALFSLGTTVGAGIFLKAIQTTSDSLPEVAMTKTIIETFTVLKNYIPFMTIPRANSRFIPPKLPAVVVDAATNSVNEVKKSIPKSLKQRLGQQQHSNDRMSMATYMNLAKLYETSSSTPKMVVFINVDPSAVLGMISFYEQIVDPKNCTPPADDTVCRHSIYSSLHILKDMPSVYQSWLVLARLCGAKAFETILRRV